MGRLLAANVALHNPETGSVEVIKAGSRAPSWAVALIENEAVYAADVDEAAGDDPAPPRTGKGSGKGAWSDYAESLGLEIPEGADRDAIVALVDAHFGA